MAPAREPFVQRSEYAKVRDALLADGAGQSTTVGITTAIHGAGGFGKTALAIELCYDERVREQYPAGILWTTMGEEIDAAGRLARVRDLIRWWTEKDPPAFETVSAASAHLRQELDGKRVLLVVDDVWRPEDVTPFHGLSARAALLVTTRDSRTLPTDSVPVHVDAMEVPEAVRLLGAGLPAGAESKLKTLAARLGEWPLLLKIVNRQLRELFQQDGLSLQQSIQEVNEALNAEGLTVFDREDLESRGQAVAQTIGASLRRLSGEEVGRFEQLAIFPEDKDIPLAVLEKLWGLASFAAKKLCGRLHDLSLLLRFDRLGGTIRLHDVIHAYLVKKGESYLPEWNRWLLDAYRPANDHWPDLPKEESYLWNHLFHHLMGAGEGDRCQSLLIDFRFLSSKLRATDVNALLADYSSFVKKDEELRLVRDFLRLSAHVLTRNPTELPGQLWGRLIDRREKGIRDLLQTCGGASSSWLRPRVASLARPGGALIRTIDHPDTPGALAVLRDGRVISGSSSGTLRVWDVESGQTLKILEGYSKVSVVAVLDSRRVLSGSFDGMLRVWDLESGQALQDLKGHSGRVTTVAILGSQVVSGSEDGTLRVWDVVSGHVRRVLEGHSSLVSALTVLDSRRVVFGSLDGTLGVWNVASGQARLVVKGYSSLVSSLAVLSIRRVVVGSLDGTVRVWDVERGQFLQDLKGHSSWVRAVAVLDSRRVVSGSEDGTLRIWDVKSGQALQVLEGHSAGVLTVAVLNSRRVVSGSLDGTLRIWDVESGQALQVLEGHSAEVFGVAVLDSRRVVSGSRDQTLRVWDLESGQARQVVERYLSRVCTVAVLDCRRVVLGCLDGTLQVWDVESGEALQILGQFTKVLAVAVLDSHRVISGYLDGTLRVWDIESSQTLQIFKGHSQLVRAVAMLDSQRVVSGSDDRTLRVWNVENGQAFHILEGHSAEVRALAVLDSRRVISSSDDKTLRVWDVESGQTLQILEGHSNGVRTVAVLDSHRVVSGSSDRTLRVWDVGSGRVECLLTLDAPVTAVAVIPGRRIIVAGDQSGRIHFFDFVEP